MGKLMDRLEDQLDTPFKKDAEDVIRLYKWIKATDKEGRVWSNRLRPLYEATWTDGRIKYKPSIIGYAVLEGIKNWSPSASEKENKRKSYLVKVTVAFLLGIANYLPKNMTLSRDGAEWDVESITENLIDEFDIDAVGDET